jgi:hypothetical protein
MTPEEVLWAYKALSSDEQSAVRQALGAETKGRNAEASTNPWR